jgi:WD40 repeat protein
VGTGRLRGRLSHPALQVYPSAFSPDGKLLAVAFYGDETYPQSSDDASAGASQGIAVWRLPARRMLWKSGKNIRAVSFPHQRQLLTVAHVGRWGYKRGICWREAQTGRVQRAYEVKHRFSREVAISIDGTLMASDDTVQVTLWDMKAGNAKQVRQLATAKQSYGALTFSPDGQWLVILNHAFIELWPMKKL